MLKEKCAKIIVIAAEKTAIHVSGKASIWLHYQPKEPSKLQKLREAKDSKRVKVQK